MLEGCCYSFMTLVDLSIRVWGTELLIYGFIESATGSSSKREMRVRGSGAMVPFG